MINSSLGLKERITSYVRFGMIAIGPTRNRPYVISEIPHESHTLARTPLCHCKRPWTVVLPKRVATWNPHDSSWFQCPHCIGLEEFLSSWKSLPRGHRFFQTVYWDYLKFHQTRFKQRHRITFFVIRKERYCPFNIKISGWHRHLKYDWIITWSFERYHPGKFSTIRIWIWHIAEADLLN